MNKIVSIHSFRRGVGKSSLAANLAALLALQKRRVALLDTDFQSPSIHLFFGIPENHAPTLNQYFFGECDIVDVVQDVTARLGPAANGQLFVLPASTHIVDIRRQLYAPVNIDQFNAGLEKLVRELDLDILLMDTPAGLTEDTLQSIAVSSDLVLVLHPDKQDFQGTAVTVEVARNLQINSIYLVLNDVQGNLDIANARTQLEQTYHCAVGAILIHSEELMALASSQLFALSYPHHPLTTQLKTLAEHFRVSPQ